jgi:hypothetical protein
LKVVCFWAVDFSENTPPTLKHSSTKFCRNYFISIHV